MNSNALEGRLPEILAWDSWLNKPPVERAEFVNDVGDKRIGYVIGWTRIDEGLALLFGQMVSKDGHVCNPKDAGKPIYKFLLRDIRSYTVQNPAPDAPLGHFS